LGRIGDAIRPGIVHRLDKDTSGTMVVAKTAAAHQNLSEQFKSRQVRKTYLALVHGIPKGNSGIIDFPIGRHPVDRKRMSTASRSGRSAETRWQVKERFTGTALLKVDIRTGRTHQIRVHCAAAGHPVVGDTVYGGRRPADRHCRDKAVADLLNSAPRQMLHARRLELDHPVSGERMVFDSPLPDDMSGLIDALRNLSAPA
jgi:23S rRNA pseudouridine1911/1915/1917 synthase